MELLKQILIITKSARTYGVALHVNDDNVTYFNSFRVEHIA